MIDDAPQIDEALMQQNAKINILVEIVGATQLSHNWIQEDAEYILSQEYGDSKGVPAFEPSSSIPEKKTRPLKMSTFCRVEFKNKMLHQTLKIPNNDNPIWTIDTGSLFIFSISFDEIMDPSVSEFEGGSNLIFEVRNKKTPIMNLPDGSSLNLKNSESLGIVSISPRIILEKYCTEGRFEFEIMKSTRECNFETHGYLSLRFRVATANDVQFVREIISPLRNKNIFGKRKLGKPERIGIYENRTGYIATEKDDVEVLGNDVFEFITSAALSLRNIHSSSKTIIVKPHPDPRNLLETRFMTKNQIELQTFTLPSDNWVKAGSGKLGKIYLEILACHDLPNTDFNIGGVGDKTDAFVSVVYEDVLVQTPVIQNELSPRWLPWTQRAFILGMMYPSSLLYLSVFDYGSSLTGHEPIGRVAINVGNLKKDIMYTLKYNLYRSSNMTVRKKQGSITIRLRIEIADERALLFARLRREPTMHVNTKKKSTLEVVRFTCFGEDGCEDKFERQILQSYVDEILKFYAYVAFLMKHKVTLLMFWRPQVKCGFLMLPIHSIVFYLQGLIVIQRPDLFPAALFISFGLLMLASMESRLKHPSPWEKCKTFWYYLRVLLLGSSKRNGLKSRVDKNQNVKEVEDYEMKWDTTVRNNQKLQKKVREVKSKIKKEIGDEDIHTPSKSINLEIALLKSLGNFQCLLGKICILTRRIRAVLSWEDSYLSFWITMGFFGLFIISVILPVSYILGFAVKALFIVFFGPWMRVVDLYYTEEGKDWHRSIQKQISILTKTARLLRNKRENALKLKAIRIWRFGDFIANVPHFSFTRYWDRPLKESNAEPIGGCSALLCSKETEEKSEVIPGQRLCGAMIPGVESEEKENRKNSQSVKKIVLTTLKKKKRYGAQYGSFEKAIHPV